jgi:uncharacterized RDD family membrane protein YckC
VSAAGAYGAGRVHERRHQVVTPEEVPLQFTVAGAGDRLGALLLDQIFIGLGVLTLGIPLLWLFARDVVDGDLVLAILILAVFLGRNAYFPFFELAWQGRTPGKRLLGIRVVDRRGGPLTAEAVVARNLTREIEIFLPLAALSSAGALFPAAPGPARLLAVAWLLLFGLLPLFNKDRLRVGDLLAGTVVVLQPEPLLLPDLTADLTAGAAAPAEGGFTPAQLDAYGEYELQVLEDVLRASGPGRQETLEAVAAKIRARIGWEGREPAEAFLSRYYAALRGRLEGRLLFGRRRAHKHDTGA